MAADETDAVADSIYAADISKKMQVPDRITVSGGNAAAGGAGGDSPTVMSNNGFRQPSMPSWIKGARSEGEGSVATMQVPDRIMLAGNNSHVAARSTPRELQLENSVLPTSPDHVRVYTPPRSIRLDDNSAFPVHHNDELLLLSDEEGIEQSINSGAPQRYPNSNNRTNSNNRPSSSGSAKEMLSSSLGKDSSFMMMAAPVEGGRGAGGASEVAVRENMTPFEELQLVRRQIAKLNHRLMAVELENQQQQQREMIFTILVTAYFFGKFVFWVNRAT